MKKTISFLLVFCLFAFSLFSTGCGSSSGGFKFLGAVVAIAVIASSGGAASSAVFAANVRGGVASTISAAKTKVKVYNLDASAADLRGTEISNIAATFVDNKLSCTTGDDRLQVGDYLFEVYNTDSNKVFLRAILHVDGTSNDLTLEISPVTEIKTAVYKEWVAKAPAVSSVKNFELNLTAALETAMTTKADTYAETLATWDQAADIVETIAVSDIDVPTATQVTVTNNPIPNTTRPAELQSATWTTITAANIVGKQFGMRYILDTDNNTWIKFTNQDIHKLPNIIFRDEETYVVSELVDGHYDMHGHFYTEETMDGWAPVGGQFEIPEDDVMREFPHSIYKVLSDSKIEVIDVDYETDNLIEEDNYNYDARITVYNDKTYLHIRDMDDQEIYELIPRQQQPYGSVR